MSVVKWGAELVQIYRDGDKERGWDGDSDRAGHKAEDSGHDSNSLPAVGAGHDGKEAKVCSLLGKRDAASAKTRVVCRTTFNGVGHRLWKRADRKSAEFHQRHYRHALCFNLLGCALVSSLFCRPGSRAADVTQISTSWFFGIPFWLAKRNPKTSHVTNIPLRNLGPKRHPAHGQPTWRTQRWVSCTTKEGSPDPFVMQDSCCSRIDCSCGPISRKGSLYLLQNGASEVKNGLHGRWESEMMQMWQQFACCSASVSSPVPNLNWLLLPPPPPFFLPCVGVWADRKHGQRKSIRGPENDPHEVCCFVILHTLFWVHACCG